MKKKNWMVLMLRQKYNSIKEKQQLWDKLKERYGKKSSEIIMTNKNSNPGLSFYVFIKETNDQNELFRKLQKEKYFQISYDFMTISDQEVINLTRGLNYKREDVRFGDIVKIKTGKYQKLYGIVLRELRGKRIQIGLKFCFGTVYQELDGVDVQVTGNIFNFIKINK